MSTDQLRQALRDVDFPAGKDEPKDPAEELQPSPAQRAAQARERRHHGGQHLSQYLREVPKPAVEDELDEN